MNNQEPRWGDHLLESYERMMENLVEQLQEISEKVTPKIEQALDRVKKNALQWEKLSTEEAEHLADVLRKDLQSAGRYLAEGRKELGEWFKFDVDLLEDRFLEFFTKAADQSAVEWLNLRERAWDIEHYSSGEIAGPGALICESCAQEIHFQKPGHIPPCPKCHGSVFHRPRQDET